MSCNLKYPPLTTKIDLITPPRILRNLIITNIGNVLLKASIMHVRASKRQHLTKQDKSQAGQLILRGSHQQGYILSNDLSEEVMAEIFSRLPSKSLLRFRSLSKSLCACIGSRSFIRLHTLRSPKNFMIIHKGLTGSNNMYSIHSESQLSSYETSFEYPFKNLGIVVTCKGIVCVYEFENRCIHLWNPSIRRKVTLHDLPSWNSHSHAIGFGFDPIIDDFKILRISRCSSFVYTVRTRTWREIDSLTTRFSSVKSYQCHFNGALHWVVKWKNSSDGIMTFDLSSEVFSTIELPEPSWETTQVTTINGYLAVISSKQVDTRIWVMKEYNNKNEASWSIAYKLNRNPFERAKKVFQYDINGYFLVNREIIVYNYDKQVMGYWRLEKLSNRSYIADMDVCDDTLELLDNGDII